MEMFYCERCGSRFNETVAAASSNCPRCRERDGIESTLRFRLFSRSALKVGGIEPRPGSKQAAAVEISPR